MMSTRQLCKQMHGMMRHGLNPNIGMDEVDHHRQYFLSTNYEMNEAQRLLWDASGQRREDQKTWGPLRILKHAHLPGAGLFLPQHAASPAMVPASEWQKVLRKSIRDKVQRPGRNSQSKRVIEMTNTANES